MSDKNNKKSPLSTVKAIWHNLFAERRNFILYCLAHLTYKFSLWSVLRTIGNQKVIQFTILVPIIGYYIIFSDQFCTYTASHLPIGTYCIENNPSQKTFEIYFAFVLIGTASLFYSIFCPKLIKRYENEIKLIHAENQHLTDVEISKYAEIINVGSLKIGFRIMNTEIQHEPAFQQSGFLASDNKLIKEKHLEMQSRFWTDQYVKVTQQDKTELAQLGVNATDNITKIRKNKDGFLRSAYAATDCTLVKTRITISLLYLSGFLILLKTGVTTFYSIYHIYYTATPTHWVRQIVEYISTLFIY